MTDISGSAARSDPEPRSHLQVLDGFRALSILAVLAAHMLPLGPGSLNLMSGVMGMSVFFALSGFLITRFLVTNPDPAIFFIRRIARIAPLVLVVSFAYALVWEGRPDTFLGANLYVLNYWVSAISPATSPLWSLAVEMHFYLAIGLAVWCFGARGVWVVLPAVLIVTALRIDNGAFANINTHLRVDEILSGCLLALAWTHRTDARMERVWAFAPRLFWPVLPLWLLSCHPDAQPFGYARPYFAMILIGSVLAMRSGWQVRFLSLGPLGYIALISFALYVFHSPFRHGWFDSGTDLERYLLKRPLSFAIIFSLAHISTFYFERPIVERVRKMTARPDRIRAVPAE